MGGWWLGDKIANLPRVRPGSIPAPSPISSSMSTGDPGDTSRIKHGACNGDGFRLSWPWHYPPLVVAHPASKDLRFLYVVMDPPPLTSEGLSESRSRPRLSTTRDRLRSLSANNAILRSSSTTAASSILHGALQQQANNILAVAKAHLSASHTNGLEIHPPAALQLHNWDWIAALPANFYDLWKDELTTVYASTSSLSSSADSTTLDDIAGEGQGQGKRERLELIKARMPVPLSESDSGLLKGKIDSAALDRCSSGAVQLVYMSRPKNCPQGYSEIINVG